MTFHSDLASAEFTPAPVDYRPNFYFGKHSAPTFTIKDKYFKEKPANGNPAPGDYQVTGALDGSRGKYIVSTKQSLPAISFTQAEGHPAEHVNAVVGPGSYDTDVISIEKAPRALTIGSRVQNTDLKTGIPAPNAYSPKQPKSQQHRFSLQGKHYAVLTDQRDFPGPGEYDAARNLRGPQHSIHGRSEVNYDNGVPGPCNYRTEQRFGNPARAKSFNRAGKFQKLASDTPAANQYYLPSSFDGKNGFSLRSRHTKEPSNNVPAANHYAPVYDSVQKNVHGAVIHDKFAQRTVAQGPGVGYYDINTPARSAKPITIAPRYNPVQSKDDVPGPYVYSPNTDFTKRAVADIKLGVKYEHREKHLKVGPGSYDLYRSISKDYANVPVFHERHRAPKALMENPGPGAYAVDRDWKRKRNGGYIAGKTHRAWRTEL